MKPDFVDPWLVRQRQPQARLRLICLAHAGGQPSAYLPWQSVLGPHVEVCAVQLPGRAMRFGEAPLRKFRHVLDELLDMVGRHDDLPYVLFGHSLGALLAYELARASVSGGVRRPLHVFVSGCGAPQIQRVPRRLHEMEDEALADALRRYDGTPSEVLADRELMQLLFPVLRADFAVVDDYCYQPGPKLPMPLTVLAGRQDAEVPVDNVLAWPDETDAGCEILWFEGGHFFIETARGSVVNHVAERLRPLLHCLGPAAGSALGVLTE